MQAARQKTTQSMEKQSAQIPQRGQAERDQQKTEVAELLGSYTAINAANMSLPTKEKAAIKKQKKKRKQAKGTKEKKEKKAGNRMKPAMQKNPKKAVALPKMQKNPKKAVAKKTDEDAEYSSGSNSESEASPDSPSSQSESEKSDSDAEDFSFSDCSKPGLAVAFGAASDEGITCYVGVVNTVHKTYLECQYLEATKDGAHTGEYARSLDARSRKAWKFRMYPKHSKHRKGPDSISIVDVVAIVQWEGCDNKELYQDGAVMTEDEWKQILGAAQANCAPA